MKPCSPVWTDETLRELAVHGTEQFPFTCYHSQLGTGPCASVPWHWHREIELVLVEGGVAHCLLGNERLTLTPGQGVFIHSGVIHSFESPTIGNIISILFLPAFIAPEGSAIHTKFVAPFSQTNCSYSLLRGDVRWQAETLAELRTLSDTVLAAEPTAELQVHATVCRMWARLYLHQSELISLGGATQSALLYARLRRMIAFIEEHYAARLTLERIAADASISKSEALRCFRHGVQTTPMAYLNRYRLDVARSRLLSTAASVTEIAVESGFASTAYFDRLFRRSYGFSPATYRKQHLAQAR